MPVVRLGLSELVVVVREAQIDSSAVDVQGISEHLRGHDTALDVPARPTSPPRTVPRRFAGLALLPEREVCVGALPLRGAQRPLSLRQRRGHRRLAPRQLAVAMRVTELADVEVDRALGLIGEVVGDDLFNVLDDLGHELCHTREHIRHPDPEGVHVFDVLLLVVRSVRPENLGVRDLLLLLLVQRARNEVGGFVKEDVGVRDGALLRLCHVDRLFLSEAMLVVGGVQLLLQALHLARLGLLLYVCL
mmetsp:Transcript_5645/g.13597  ORF Transcript_5645/g.13597 Transcript_5645/m.13597 type:complete len:247 (-) Transcript_5645:479-1219(-)